MNNKRLAEKYFSLSNDGNLYEIEKILDDNIVYSSENVGLIFTKEKVMLMKKKFFGSFISLHWLVEKIEEKDESIFLFHFLLNGTLSNGDKISKRGEEIVVVKDGKIHFVQVKNK